MRQVEARRRREFFDRLKRPWCIGLAVMAALIAAGLEYFLLPDFRADLFSPSGLFVGLWVPLYAGFVVLFIAASVSAQRAQSAARIDVAEGELRGAIARTDGGGSEKVQPAWDLARATLEQYWHRNALQNWLIFGLSVAAVIAGFIFMVYGTYGAIHDSSKLQSAVVATTGGALTQFVGATFLLVYRSTMQQMTTFNATLERINSVGMAWYVVESMSTQTAADRSLRNRLQGLVALQIIKAPAAIGDSLKDDDSKHGETETEPKNGRSEVSSRSDHSTPSESDEE
jgi:hypothetical protein